MGNSLCGASGSAAVKPAMSKQTSNLSRRSAQSTSSGGERGRAWHVPRVWQPTPRAAAIQASSLCAVWGVCSNALAYRSLCLHAAPQAS